MSFEDYNEDHREKISHGMNLKRLLEAMKIKIV